MHKEKKENKKSITTKKISRKKGHSSMKNKLYPLLSNHF